MGRIVKISVQTLRVTKMYLGRNFVSVINTSSPFSSSSPDQLKTIVIFIVITITIIIIIINFYIILICQILLLETRPKIPLARLKINRIYHMGC